MLNILIVAGGVILSWFLTMYILLWTVKGTVICFFVPIIVAVVVGVILHKWRHKDDASDEDEDDETDIWCLSCRQPVDADDEECPNCGKPLDETKMVVRCPACNGYVLKSAVVCPKCGSQIAQVKAPVRGLVCPSCGSSAVTVQVDRIDYGSRTVTKTRGTIKQKRKRHGLFWYAGGWMFDGALWVCAFPFKFAHEVLRPKKYATKQRTVSTTRNNIGTDKVCICQRCGHVWHPNELLPSGIVGLLK